MQRAFPSRSRAVSTLWLNPRNWLLLLLLAAWALRLYHLGTMSIWWDESLSWARALSNLPTILSNTIQIQNTVTHDLHPPLYFVLLHYSVILWGATEFGLRVLSTFSNLLSLALLYPLTKLLVGKRGTGVALLAVLFATLSPFYVWYSQEARPYSLVLFWSMLALYGLLKWLYGRPQTWRDLPSISFALFVGALGATLATHYLSFVLLPFFALTLWLYGIRQLQGTRRERVRSPLTLIAVVLLLGFAAIFAFIPGGSEQLTGSDYGSAHLIPFFVMLRDVWNSFAVGVTANLDTVGWFDFALVVLWVLGIFSTVRVRSRNVRLAVELFSYLILPALALQLGSYLRPLYLNSRHLITTSPAFYIGIALGVDALAVKVSALFRSTLHVPRSTPSRPASLIYAALTVLLAALVVGGALYSLNNLYCLPETAQANHCDPTFAKDDHKGWAEFLRERLRPDDFVILVAPQAEKIVEYYAPPGMQWQSLPNFGQTRDWQEFLDREAVLNAYRKHGRVWLLEIHQPVGDPDHHIANLLQRYGDSTDITFFPGISTRLILQEFLYHGVVQPRKLKQPNAQDTIFDGNLHLTGFESPKTIAAGGRAPVKLYWWLHDKTPNNVSASLRVVGEDGTVWGQWDAPPVGNLFPTSKWNAHDTMLDVHDLVTDPGTPPGKYTIQLSVYNDPGHTPLTAAVENETPTDDPLTLATIQVTRPKTPVDPRTLVMDGHADVAFGDAAHFVGYDLEEPNPDPGSTVPVTLYFQLGQNPPPQLSGQVALGTPWWQFWNQMRASTPFTIDLTNRQPGDLVQTRVGAHVPGDASAGGYDLALSVDGHASQSVIPATGLTFSSVQVQPLARSADLPPIAHPMDTHLGDSVEFLGYDLNTGETLKPGDHVKLTLYWRALKTMEIPYTVFAHLLNGGKLYGQQDSQPLGGTRPTTSWAPGETFTDTYEFDVASDAPAGAYQIEIGMYNAADSTRLPVTDAQGNPAGDRILFEELRVQ